MSQLEARISRLEIWAWGDGPVPERLPALADLMNSQWQDISTAPKDQHILIYGPYRDGSGFYQEVCKHWRHCWPVEWMDNCLAPTHWQPLPAPPTPQHSDAETE